MPEFSLEWMVSYATQVVVVVFGIFIVALASMFLARRYGAPWVISDDHAINRMLQLAELEQDDLVVDLGAGDGRILIRAVQTYPVAGLGFEIDPLRVFLARFFIWRRGLTKRIKIVWGDIFKSDISDADAIVMYMTRESNARLRSIFEEQLKLGTTIVCNAFPIPGWTPIKIDNINLIFVYRLGETDDTVITEFV